MSVATKDALSKAAENLKQDVVLLLTTYNTNHPNAVYESPEAATALVDKLIPRIAGVMVALGALHGAAKADIEARDSWITKAEDGVLHNPGLDERLKRSTRGAFDIHQFERRA